MVKGPEFKENKDVYRIFIKYFVWILYFVFIIFMYSWQNIKVAEFEYKIKTLEKEVEMLVMENKKLETEFCYLSSPERIKKIATEKLGLVPLSENDIIWVATYKK